MRNFVPSRLNRPAPIILSSPLQQSRVRPRLEEYKEAPDFLFGGSIAFDARKLFHKAAADEHRDQCTHTQHTERGRFGNSRI